MINTLTQPTQKLSPTKRGSKRRVKQQARSRAVSSAVKAELCKRDFIYFVKEFWGVNANTELEWNWHMSYLCRHAERQVSRVADWKPKKYDSLINVPPATTKSTIFSIMLPAWSFAKWPWMQFICASYQKDLSLDLAVKSRNIIQSAKYREYFPDVRICEDQNIKSHYYIEAYNEKTEEWEVKGFRLSSSTDGKVTGYHAHVIIIDDPLNPKEAASDLERAHANEWLDQTVSNRKVHRKISVTMMIMQRLHQDDCSGHWESKKTDMFHIRLPAEIIPRGDEEQDQNRRNRVLPQFLLKYYDRGDGYLDPNRLDEEACNQEFENLGPYGYSGQMDQNPVPIGRGVFKVENVSYLDFMPEPSELEQIVRYWDKAGTSREKNINAKYSCGTKMAKHIPTNKVVILDVRRGQFEISKREGIIRDTADADGPDVTVWMEQEPGSGGKESAEASVANLKGYLAFAEKPTGDKKTRAGPLAAQMDSGNVLVVRNEEWNKPWIEEFRNFPVGKYSDQVDSATGAFSKISNVAIARVIPRKSKRRRH